MAANAGWYGLTWRNSWPLALVAVGAGIVVRALAGQFLPPPALVTGADANADEPRDADEQRKWEARHE
jgi:hypothetical protein